MKTIEWADQIGSRERKPFLLLVTDSGDILRFRGEALPGVAGIIGATREKNGKWSCTHFEVVVHDTTWAIPGFWGFATNRFLEGLSRALGIPTIRTWDALASGLGVSREKAEEFLRRELSGAAEEIDQNEAVLAGKF